MNRANHNNRGSGVATPAVPHPCDAMANRYCTLGEACPFFGLPNDVCVPFAEGWCTFGERCKRRHLGGAKLAELRALPSSQQAVERHARQQAERAARKVARQQTVPRCTPVPPSAPHPRAAARGRAAAARLSTPTAATTTKTQTQTTTTTTTTTMTRQQQQQTSLIVNALVQAVASVALDVDRHAATTSSTNSTCRSAPSSVATTVVNASTTAACPCAAQRGECAAGAHCWFRGERRDLCVAYVRGACAFGAACKRHHDDELASAFRELMAIEANAKVDEAWLRENTRVCPSCRVPVVRTQGCNHMQCRCGYAFDWAAMADVHGAGSAALFKQRVVQTRKARLATRDDRFQIFVCAQSGATITLELPLRAQTPLSALVALVVARTTIDGDALRLLYGGKQLSLQHSPHATLADFNVQNGATLHLVMRLSGGGGGAPTRRE